MPWHVGSDDRGGPLHYSCGVAGEGEGLVVVGGGRRGKGGGKGEGGHTHTLQGHVKV